jgi:hypothetical protein
MAQFAHYYIKYKHDFAPYDWEMTRDWCLSYSVRTVWDDKQEKWFFCVADVVEALTDSVNPTDYIKK